MQAAKINYPSSSYKTNLAEVDEDDILFRISKLNVKTYHYTPEWLGVRGIPDVAVRGLIAQEVNQHFPEHVNIEPLNLEDTTFPEIPDFHKIDKQALSVDLIAAFNAHARRFRVEANTKDDAGGLLQSGDITMSSREALSTGRVMVISGASSSKSGAVQIKTGDATNGVAGGIEIQTGNSNANR